MTPNDVAFAIKLTDTMNWNYIKDDFKRMMDLEPEGCFIALDGTQRVGITTTIKFDNLGWIGNVIVDRDHRLRGIGSGLVKHAMEYLRSRSATTMGLYSYLDTIPFYEKLGFKKSAKFIRLVGLGVTGYLGAKAPRRMMEKDLQDVIALDRLCVGVSRERLLRRIFADSGDLCHVVYENTRLVGFIMALGTEIGPLVCRHGFEEEAINLLRAVLNRLVGLEVHIGVPVKRREIIDALRDLNFKDHFQVMRMYYGDHLEDKGCILAMESLERG